MIERSVLIGGFGMLYVSYAVLCALIAFSAILLHRVMTDTVWLISMGGDASGQPATPPTCLPEFSAGVLGTEASLTAADFRGKESILMFVRPADGTGDLDGSIRTSVHGLSHKCDRNLFIVCTGAPDACRGLLPELDLTGHKWSTFPILIDDCGRIARAFGVRRTPAAFLVDAQARIVRSGLQV